MAKGQGAALDRKKLLSDPIMVTTIVVLIAFLTLFILYPLAILLVDSFVGDGGFGFSVFKRIFKIPTFTTAITNTLKVGFLVGILSTIVGLLFAYVEVYLRMNKFVGGLFKVVSMLPVVSPPFVLSLSMIMLFGKAGIITRHILGIYDNSVYGFWGIAVVQTLTFFPVCYMMLKGLLKNIDPSLEEAARDMGARHTVLLQASAAFWYNPLWIQIDLSGYNSCWTSCHHHRCHCRGGHYFVRCLCWQVVEDGPRHSSSHFSRLCHLRCGSSVGCRVGIACQTL